MPENYYTVVGSGARTTTGNSGVITVPSMFHEMMIFVDVTAVSGTTPTLTFDYEVTPDGGTNWYTVKSNIHAANITATGNYLFRAGPHFSADAADVIYGPFGMDARIVWTIGGTTPSFTFSILMNGKRYDGLQRR